MELVTMNLSDIHPYKNNPRKNDGAVEAVRESILQCGYVAPIIVDENMEILAGHTRYKVLKSMGGGQIQVIVREGLTEEQKRKYRILDNKTNEFAEWDFEKLEQELADLDFGDFDFGFEDMPDELEEKPEKEEKLKDDVFQIIVDCSDEYDLENKYQQLQEMGIECRISTL